MITLVVHTILKAAGAANAQAEASSKIAIIDTVKLDERIPFINCT